MRSLLKLVALIVTLVASGAIGAGIFAWVDDRAESSTGGHCIDVANWSNVVQELYFVSNDVTLSSESKHDQLNEQFGVIANIVLPPTGSYPRSDLLPLIYQHNSEIEHWLSAWSRGAQNEKEALRLRLNETVRTVNGLLAHECDIQPIALYQARQ